MLSMVPTITVKMSVCINPILYIALNTQVRVFLERLYLKELSDYSIELRLRMIAKNKCLYLVLHRLCQMFICITQDVMMVAQLIVRSSLAQNKRFIFLTLIYCHISTIDRIMSV